jgi:hypothetical protein
VEPCSEAIFLKKPNGDEEFYVRTGPQTVRLGMSEAFQYAESHFKR